MNQPGLDKRAICFAHSERKLRPRRLIGGVLQTRVKVMEVQRIVTDAVLAFFQQFLLFAKFAVEFGRPFYGEWISLVQ